MRRGAAEPDPRRGRGGARGRRRPLRDSLAAHDDEEHPPGRRVDWRTVLCGVVGAVAFGLLPHALRRGRRWRWLVFGAWFVTLDRRPGHGPRLSALLPDELTLPVIPVALLYAVSGLNPLVGGALGLAVLAAVLIPAVLYLPSIPFGAGAFGLGDVKLLVGMGLLLGGERALGGTLFGLILAGVVLLVAAGHPPGRAEVVRAVRAVPDHRGAVGRADPGLRSGARLNAD